MCSQQLRQGGETSLQVVIGQERQIQFATRFSEIVYRQVGQQVVKMADTMC